MKKSRSLKKVLPVFFVFLLAPVVFSSGCVEDGGVFQSIFQAVGLSQTETVAAPKDVLLTQNVQVIPNPPITADSVFTLTFQVINIGKTQEGEKEARNVRVYAYDWGRCEPQPKDGQEIVADGSMTGLKEQETKNIRIYPGGGAELIDWDFKAPSNYELGYMDGKCPIRFKTLYTFDAYTTADISIIDRNRLVEAHRAGEVITVAPVQTQSRGPIKIGVDFETGQPVDENLIIPVLIKVYDKGSGMYEKVPQGMLVIEFPGDFDVISCTPDEWMSNSGNTRTNSDGDIPLVRGESPSIRCDLRINADKKADIRDIKTYSVVAKILGYEYPLYGEKSVAIKPTYAIEEGGVPPGDGGGGNGGGTCVSHGTPANPCVCFNSTDCGNAENSDCISESYDCSGDECCCCWTGS